MNAPLGAQVPLLWPWLCALLLSGVAAVTALAVIRRRRRTTPPHTSWIANSEYMAELPEYRRLLRRHRLLRGAVATGLAIAVAGAAMIAARPVATATVDQRLGTRDIVLCLDVSGSMIDYDGEILTVFQRLVENFHGERIALSIFNSSSRTVFPLTDDYPMVQEQLDEGIRAFDQDDSRRAPSRDREAEYFRYTAGTTANEAGASLVGDGLASCILQFDDVTARSRSVVLATDNDSAGEAIYTLPQAADLAASRDIALYGIFGGDAEYQEGPQEREYRSVVEKRGGLYLVADDPTAVRRIVDDVVATQADDVGARPESPHPEHVVTDRPRRWFLVLLVGVGVLVVALWRVRE